MRRVSSSVASRLEVEFSSRFAARLLGNSNENYEGKQSRMKIKQDACMKMKRHKDEKHEGNKMRWKLGNVYTVTGLDQQKNMRINMRLNI